MFVRLLSILGQSSKSSSGVSSPTFPSGSVSPCDFQFSNAHNGMMNDFTELQSRMSHMNEAFNPGWDRDRRLTSGDYEEKQIMAFNGMSVVVVNYGRALMSFSSH